jgi:hypothetical protein
MLSSNGTSAIGIISLLLPLKARNRRLTDSTAEKQTRKVVSRTDLLQEVLRRDFQQDIEDEEGSLRCHDDDARL